MPAVNGASAQFARILQRLFRRQRQKIDGPDHRKRNDQCQPIYAPK